MDDPIVQSVINKFIERSKKGMIKYGMTMAANPATTIEWINHAQEEVMDFILYLERLKRDFEEIPQSKLMYWPDGKQAFPGEIRRVDKHGYPIE